MEAEVNTKSDNIIQLKKNDSILRLRIQDEDGNDTGNYLEFDLEDIELPTRYQDIIEEDKKNRANLKNQFIIIDKKQDHKGKKLLSSNEEAKIKAMQGFYKREIDEIIEKSILPQLQINAEKIKEKIMSKYGEKKEDIIE